MNTQLQVDGDTTHDDLHNSTITALFGLLVLRSLQLLQN